MGLDSNTVGSITFTIQAVDTASAQLRNVQGSLDNVSRSAGGTSASMLRLATGFAAGIVEFKAADLALSTFSDTIVGFNAHLEQSQVAWTTFLHSSTLASNMIAQLQHFAAVTPFRFQGLEDSARLLTAMGVAGDKVIPLLTDIGNAVSATGRGAEGMQRVAYVLGEIQSLGQVDDRTLRQLTIDGGIPAFEMLAQAMGKSTQEIRQMASEGKISADQFMTIFHNFVSQNWGDLMAQQAITFSGAMSTLQDNVQLTLAHAFHPLFDAIRDLVVAQAEASQADSWTNWADATSRNVQRVVTDVEILVALYERLHGVAQQVTTAPSPTPGQSILSGAGEGAQQGAAAGALQAIAPQFVGLSDVVNAATFAVNAFNGGLDILGSKLGIVAPQARTMGERLDDNAAALSRLGTTSIQARDPIQHLGDTMAIVAGDAAELRDRSIEVEGAIRRAANAVVDLSSLPNANIFPGSAEGPSSRAAERKTQQATLNAEIDSGAQSFRNYAGSVTLAVAGLQAFDNATFGLTQQLAGVQLAIEQRRLDRMLRHTPHTLGGQAALLEEEIKVRGLERQVTFGGAIHAFDASGGSRGATNAPYGLGATTLPVAKDTYGTTVNLQLNVNDTSMVGAVVQGHLNGLLAGVRPGTSNSANRRLPGAQ